MFLGTAAPGDVPSNSYSALAALADRATYLSLAERVNRRLGNDGALTIAARRCGDLPPADTTAAKLWADGHMTVGALWRLYAEYPYMPRLPDRAVLDAGLTGPQLLWEQEGFALADGYENASGKYRALVLPTDGVTVAVTDATLIVRPEGAKARRAAELTASQGSSGSQAGAGPEPAPARNRAQARSRRAGRDSSAASAYRPTATHRTPTSSPTRFSVRSGRRPA